MSEKTENALAVAQNREELVSLVSSAWGRSADEVNAMVSVSFPTLKTLGQLTVAFWIAKKYDLDPMVKEMYAYIDHRGNLTTIVGKDGFMKIARKQAGYLSLHSVAVYPGDDFDIDFAEGKILKHRMGGQWMATRTGNPIGAYAVLRMKDRPDIVNWVDWNEYAGTSGPWTKQKGAMIRKCAIATICREAFGLSGLYDEAEIFNAEDVGVKLHPVGSTDAESKFKRVPAPKKEAVQETPEPEKEPEPETVEAEAVEEKPEAEIREPQTATEPESFPASQPTAKRSAAKNLREANDEIANEIEKTKEFQEVFGSGKPAAEAVPEKEAGPKKDQLARIADLCAELGYDTSDFVPTTEEGAALVIKNLAAESKERAAKPSPVAKPAPAKTAEPVTVEDAVSAFSDGAEAEERDPKEKYLEIFKDYTRDEIEEAGRDAKARFIEARAMYDANPTEANKNARMEVAAECAALAQIKASFNV